MDYTQAFLFGTKQGMLLGIIFAIFTFVVNKIYVFTQLYLHKKRYPNEKILFFYSVPWQGSIFIPFLFGFCIGSAIILLYQFSEIKSISIITQNNKPFFLLILLTGYINWLLIINHIYIFTTEKIKIKMPDKFKFLIWCWISSQEILYQNILSIQKYRQGIYIKLNNDKLLDLRCLNPKKVYQKLQLLLNEEKEND